MKYIDIELLRKEIERRFWDYGTPLHDEEVTKKVDEILDILDTIPEQPVKGLEEEIDRLWESFSEEMSGPHNLFDMYRRLARHFAEWGAEHLRDSAKMIPGELEEAAESHTFFAAYQPGQDWETHDVTDAFKAGAEWMKSKYKK